MIRIAVVALPHPEIPDLFLHGLRRDNGKWALPGGHAKDGEVMSEAARRELNEETGLQVAKLEQVRNGTYPTDNGDELEVTLFMGSPTDFRPNSDEDPDGEFLTFKYADPNDLVNVHVPKERNILIEHLNNVAKSDDLEKMGVARRLAPFNPVKDVRQEDKQQVAQWQDYAHNPRAIRDTLAHMHQHAKIRATNKLMSHTKWRVNSESKEREFLLHRGMSPSEYNGNVDETNGIVHHHIQRSSWTPDYDKARDFTSGSYLEDAGIPVDEEHLDQDPKVVSAWIPESKIIHMPKMYGRLSAPGAFQSPKGGRNFYDHESEVIVDRNHRSKIEPFNPIHDMKNRSFQEKISERQPGEILGDLWAKKAYEKAVSRALETVPKEQHAEIKARMAKIHGVKLAANEKTFTDIKKGVMRRLAPFNPVSIPGKERISAEKWTGGYGDDPQRDRRTIPKMSHEGIMRGVNKILKLTQHRRNSHTGEIELLMHRGMGHDEHASSLQYGKYHGDDPSSWTPVKSVAHAFAGDYSDFVGKGKPDVPGHLVSAWIPVSKIHHIPFQLGSTARDYDVPAVPGAVPTKHLRRREHEVIVDQTGFEIHSHQPVQRHEKYIEPLAASEDAKLEKTPYKAFDEGDGFDHVQQKAFQHSYHPFGLRSFETVKSSKPVTVNGKPMFHHVYDGLKGSNKVRHMLSFSSDPKDEGVTNSMGRTELHENGYPILRLSTTAAAVGHEKSGYTKALYHLMAKYHGEIQSDDTTAPETDAIYSSLKNHNDLHVTMGAPFSKERHTVSYLGEADSSKLAASEQSHGESLKKMPKKFTGTKQNPYTTVVRVQNKEGYGPYTAGEIPDLEEHGVHPDVADRTPRPSDDEGFTPADLKELDHPSSDEPLKFGFEDDKQLHGWFEPHEIEAMARDGFAPQKIKASHVWGSGKQVFFQRYVEPNRVKKKMGLKKAMDAGYLKDANAGYTVLVPVTVNGAKDLAPGIPHHITVKMFRKPDQQLTSEYTGKINDRLKSFNLSRPDPAKLSFHPHILTSPRTGKTYYSLKVNGMPKEYYDMYDHFKDVGITFPEYQPHITIDKEMYDHLSSDPNHMRTLDVKVHDPELRLGSTVLNSWKQPSST